MMMVLLLALFPQMELHAAAADNVTLNSNTTTYMNLGDNLYTPAGNFPYIVSFELKGPSGNLVESASYRTSGSFQGTQEPWPSSANQRLFTARTTGTHTLYITTGHLSYQYSTATGVTSWKVDGTSTLSYNIEIADPCIGGHAWGEWKQIKAPTCTQAGQKMRTCARCNATEYENIPAEHSWSKWETTVLPTCTKPGETTRYCTVCNLTESKLIDALGHSWGEWTQTEAPTCTKTGVATHYCISCNEAEASLLEALGHKWDSGKVTKEPTETAEGVKTYTCTVCGETRTESIPKLTPSTPANPFVDVKQGAYYYDPVLWAVNHQPQITNGTGANTFSPEATCTRGQVVTFLWRAKGCPEPKSANNPFTDVKEGAYYYKAVLCANENNITNGTGATTFSPESPCTRAHVVTFLWRTANKLAAGSSNPFKDVPAGQYFTDAVLWAVNHNPQITNGTGADTFSPDNPCTRGQIVTFLYRYMK